MKYFLALTALAGLSSAHSFVTHFHFNGKADSTCVRQADSADPIIDLTSDTMACNAVSTAATSKCAVKGGDTVEFEWRVDRNIAPADYPLNADGERVGVTDVSHMGPCAVYAKKVSDALTSEGPGDGWFKIMEDGLDSNGVFCTTRLREANAYQSTKIPMTIEPGDYLLRAEFLTLNNAGPKSIGGEEQPQFYSGCVQVTITGTSGTAKPATVSIPGYVNKTSPGLIFDVWNSPTGTFSNYPIPGPVCFSDATSSVTTSTTNAATSTTPATTTASPATTDLATFPNNTEFPGASTANLPESIQTFSTGPYSTGPAPELTESLQTFTTAPYPSSTPSDLPESIATFSDSTEFPGASTADLSETIQTFSTGTLSPTHTVPELSEHIVTFTTTTYPTGSVPVLSESTKTFPGSLYYSTDSTSTEIAGIPSDSASNSMSFPEEGYLTVTTKTVAVSSSSSCSYYATVTVTNMATTFSTSTRTKTALKSKSAYYGQ